MNPEEFVEEDQSRMSTYEDDLQTCTEQSAVEGGTRLGGGNKTQ